MQRTRCMRARDHGAAREHWRTTVQEVATACQGFSGRPMIPLLVASRLMHKHFQRPRRRRCGKTTAPRGTRRAHPTSARDLLGRTRSELSLLQPSLMPHPLLQRPRRDKEASTHPNQDKRTSCQRFEKDRMLHERSRTFIPIGRTDAKTSTTPSQEPDKKGLSTYP